MQASLKMRNIIYTQCRDKNHKAFMRKNLFPLQHLIPLLLIGILAISVYWNSLSGSFFWDDTFLIADNEAVKSLSFHSIKAFFIDRNAYPSAPGEIYKPLYLFSFALNYRLNGLNPMGYHATNLLVHLANSLLFYLLLIRLTDNARLSLISSLIFALHPIHTESVSWIKGRDDLLALLLMQLSLLAYIIGSDINRKILYICLSIVAYIMALLFKEMAVTFPGILLLYDLLLKGGKPHISRYIPYLIITLLYLSLRTYVLGQIAGTERWTGGITETTYTIIKSIGFYIKLLLLPINLCSDYGSYPFTNNPDIGVVLSAFAIAVFCLILYGIRKRRIVIFAILWFFLTLLPVLNIIPIKIGIAERYLYIPSIGFSVLIGFVLERSWVNKGIVMFFITAFVLIFYSIGTLNRNEVWSDNSKMLKDTIDKFPGNARSHYNLGNLYKDRAEWDLALHHWKEATKFNPNHSEAHNQLGNLYLMKGEYILAHKEYEEALKINPNNIETYYNMAITLESLGNTAEALKYYKSFLNMAPERLKANIIQAKKRIYALEFQ